MEAPEHDPLGLNRIMLYSLLFPHLPNRQMKPSDLKML
jgi:hypothetical protein